ncbi:MAG: hypothetical protein EU550_02850, partial [Promethearchaeota archaeon]
VLNEVADWCFCANHKGKKGWIPKKHLEPLIKE